MSEIAASEKDAGSDSLQAGRDAHARRDWPTTFDLLTEADHERALAGPDLEILAEAAFFAAHLEERTEAKERAFAAYLAGGDQVRASYIALDLAHDAIQRGNPSIASGWVRRAERILAGQPESYPHGFLALIHGELARTRGDIEAAGMQAAEALAIAERTQHADLRALALSDLATVRIATGATSEGMTLLEEAAIAAVNGELTPVTAGITSCQMISVCRDMTDYQRASEWLDATDRWCKRQDVSAFPGICRIHRAEIVALHGGWERAERELQQATTELSAYSAAPPVADGFYAIGEIRRLKGDSEGAEVALREAHALGRSPQPALALLRLDAGKVHAAGAAIDAALAEATWDPWARVRLLVARVEIAIAAGDVEQARRAADDLAGLIGDDPPPALDAGRHLSIGRVLLAENDASEAVGELRAAARAWREVDAPYELARTRAVLSRALRAVGNEDDADLELRAARDEFERLGAAPDLAAADGEIRSLEARHGHGAQIRSTFMFTDIEGSTNLAEALGDEAWEGLLAWHDTTLRDLITRGGGTIVNNTGDGFFAAFDDAGRAVTCAIGIQRALDDHRRGSGFAPRVRIGLHVTDATERAGDYSGVGVNLAARISALAGGGEIVASTETLHEAGRSGDGSDVREVPIRGVTAPVQVATIPWTQS